jgi:hypothetical protein
LPAVPEGAHVHHPAEEIRDIANGLAIPQIKLLHGSLGELMESRIFPIMDRLSLKIAHQTLDDASQRTLPKLESIRGKLQFTRIENP